MTLPTNVSSVVSAGNTNVLEAYAKSLIEYADTRSIFAHTLYILSEDLKRNCERSYTSSAFPSASCFTPKDDIHAEAKARWLLNEIEIRPDAYGAHAIVHEWREQFEPQDFVIGIVGLAVTGPTLGLIDSNRKPKSKMPIVITKHERKTTSTMEQANLVTKAGVGLLAQELTLVGGNAYRLEPDLADWCFADQPIMMATTPNYEHLEHLKARVRSEGVPYFSHEVKERIEALALTPSLSDEYLSHLDIHPIVEAKT